MNDIKDALSFVQFFIEFCMSKEASIILARFAKAVNRKPFWTLGDAQKYLKIYKNSLLITAYLKNVAK